MESTRDTSQLTDRSPWAQLRLSGPKTSALACFELSLDEASQDRIGLDQGSDLNQSGWARVGGVLEITSAEGARVDLVGGKAASLRELGSIPGICVPAGFSITTGVYADYLERIGAADDIAKLETLSEQWKKLKEDDPWRGKLVLEMRGTAWRIQQCIMDGTLPSEVLQAILVAYGNLGENGQATLVAVRSSATAEDMLGASFAGQYSTYLNQQGDVQVIEAIKKVWASTYNMNAVEYRNKHNMQHSKNRMCALVLEMVNPQSAGTAFSVDPETGAPFICINNTYGLGEAEVAGIVTSDSWIVEPHSAVIIKRRLGEKAEKIVYDPVEKMNVTVAIDRADRERFAISPATAKKIALLVKKIGEHYANLNPEIKHIDVEYAVTEEGRIIFTQARPETVWALDRRTLTAVAKKVDEYNAALQEPYPEIFKGGVTGASGVARGVLRVVSTVQDAEERVRPGDIMVAPNTTNAWEHVMGRAGGIITEIGGPGNHTAVVSREQNKAAIVGASGSMSALKMYEGRMVTVDATSKKVYLGEVPEELEYSPDKISVVYSTLFSQNVEESWKEAEKTMTTTIDPDGGRWINKPNQVVRLFLQNVFAQSHQWVANKLNPGQLFRDRINPEGKYQVYFDDIFPWMERLAKMPIEGSMSLSSLHEERVANIHEYLERSKELILTSVSVSAWFDSFVILNGYMGCAYNIYRITEGLLQEALSKKQVPEPYLSQLWQSMAVWVGETEAVERNREYKQLLEEVKKDEVLRKDLILFMKGDPKLANLAEQHPDFSGKFDQHVFNYKIVKNSDDIFTSVPFHKELAKELLRDVSDNRTIVISSIKPEEFFPEDSQFTRIARLAFFASKLRQDSHHIKVRGQWKFVEVMQPLAELLIENGQIQTFGEIFDHTPEWIVDKVGEYERAGRQTEVRDPRFHIKPYGIQELAIKNHTVVREEPSKGGALTSMGRWRFESVCWDETTGLLVLVNATRIEEVVKPEFLDGEQHLPRDITLSTRRLSVQERDNIENLAGSLGLNLGRICVIEPDRSAAFHRIYGLSAQERIFVRADILAEGNQDQIREALDHLRLKATGLAYEDLKEIQFHGRLRDLITKLSHRTIAEKLLISLCAEKEDIQL